MTSHVQAQRSPLDVALFVLRRARGLRNPLHAAMALHLDIMLSERWGLLPAAEGAAAGAWERGGGNLRDALESELRAMKAVLDAVVDTQQLEAGQTSVHLGPTRTCRGSCASTTGARSSRASDFIISVRRAERARRSSCRTAAASARCVRVHECVCACIRSDWF